MKEASEIESYHFGEIILRRHDPEAMIISHCVVINQMWYYTHERDTDEEIFKTLIYPSEVKEKLSQGPLIKVEHTHASPILNLQEEVENLQRALEQVKEMKEALEKEAERLKRRIEEEQAAKEAKEERRKEEQDDLVK